MGLSKFITILWACGITFRYSNVNTETGCSLLKDSIYPAPVISEFADVSRSACKPSVSSLRMRHVYWQGTSPVTNAFTPCANLMRICHTSCGVLCFCSSTEHVFWIFICHFLQYVQLTCY